MPLLGRHKSPSGGSSSSNSNSPGPSNAAANSQQRRPQQPLCESPLFGIRRQLPLGDCGSTTTTTTNTKQVSGAPACDAEALSSVPQQITRQQINYAFSMMDTNKDGMIDLRDLSQMLANLGVPIDEAILSHIMSSVSKRGDHRISEAEFLDWISRFIQVSDSPTTMDGPHQRPAPNQEQSGRARRRLQGLTSGGNSNSGAKSPVSRSSTTGSCLVAQPSEVPRARRGSGSGLALLHSLSSSSGAAGTTAGRSSAADAPAAAASATSSPVEQTNFAEFLEARNDLRAAFGVFDLDGDGYITIDEVRAGLKLLGESWSPSELQNVFSKCSGSASGRGSSSVGTSSDLSGQRISIDDFVQLLL